MIGSKGKTLRETLYSNRMSAMSSGLQMLIATLDQLVAEGLLIGLQRDVRGSAII